MTPSQEDAIKKAVEAKTKMLRSLSAYQRGEIDLQETIVSDWVQFGRKFGVCPSTVKSLERRGLVETVSHRTERYFRLFDNFTEEDAE